MALERIGHVDVKSGTLLAFDFGLITAFEGDANAAKAAVVAALEAGKSEFEHEGVEGVYVRGVPPGRYPVFSETLDDGEFEGMRKAVTIELAEGVKAAKTVELGSVPVDMARLGVFDVDAVPHWNENEPADGKADIVFWGLHEEEVAKRFEAPKVDDDSYGFVDRPVAEAAAIGQKLDALRETGELRFAYDFRPHTHPYFLLAQIRANDNEAGVLDVGGYDCCGFMTTWGDGVFPVRLELDEAGKPLRCTILFATEDAMENMREVNDDDDEDEDEDDDE
jgi:hypothetical protein